MTASPTPQPAAAQQKAETAERIYEVKPGDSLSKIALEVYGNAARWSEIFEANKDQIKNPNLIHPGQKFRIP
ncbi:MAG: LysM peptidoglycan-binding domain-containing protein [Anaerolineae bacterium]|nr:LysM peptidoglycan-binding domain-containing protein [Anaerolineae bacterium]